MEYLEELLCEEGGHEVDSESAAESDEPEDSVMD